MNAQLVRHYTSDEGTFGTLTLFNGTSFVTGELPWRGNQPGKSSIPLGVYTCNWRESPRHGWCYHVDGVEGRSDIEIHSANWVGDADLGYKSQLLGCIALGWSVGELDGQKAVLSSRDAIARFHEIMGGVPFQLTIAQGV
jgi:hypothetical protein